MKTEVYHTAQLFTRLAQAKAESESLKWSAKDQVAMDKIWQRIEKKLDQQKAI